MARDQRSLITPVSASVNPDPSVVVGQPKTPQVSEPHITVTTQSQ
jgi:hypothetical protein